MIRLPWLAPLNFSGAKHHAIGLLLLLAVTLPSYGQLWSGILNSAGSGTCTGATPSGCGISWENAGIPGGIPTGTQSGSTITATGSDQTSAIQSALNSCGGTSSAEKYVNLAAGTFLVSGQLTVPSYCYLNGQGANQTIINADGTSMNGVVILGAALNSEPSTSNDTAITGGLSAGSTSITVSSASKISVGKLLSISELNSASNNVTATGSEGPCGFCDQYGGIRTSGQTVLVTAVSGTTITISPGLYWTYGATLPSWGASTNYGTFTFITNGGHYYEQTAEPASPYVCTSGSSTPSFSTSGGSVTDGTCTWLDKGAGTTTQPLATPFTPTAIEAGVENLEIYITNAGTSTEVGPNVVINQCQYCFVHGIADNYTDADHVYADYDYGGEISGSYFSNAILHTPGTYDSCLQLSSKTSQVLVQNNIFERLHESVILEHGASGNVIAYNYMLAGFDTGSPSVVIGGIDYHGAHPEFNLMEGNVGLQIYLDSVWGSSSNNTSFRNWVTGSSAVDYPEAAGRNTVTGGSTVVCSSLANDDTCDPFQASRAFQVSYLSVGNNLIGNVVGSTAQSSNIGYGSGVTKYNSGSGQTDALQWPTSRIYDSTVYGYTFGYGESADTGAWSLDSAKAYSSALLHGNYGNISGSIVWASGITQTLPASFYLSAKPSWWGSSLGWPAIGPDVTGGSGLGGHAALIPAENCYNNVMGGTDGRGSPLAFNAISCYGASGNASIAAPPTVSSVIR